MCFPGTDHIKQTSIPCADEIQKKYGMTERMKSVKVNENIMLFIKCDGFLFFSRQSTRQMYISI